MQVRRRHGVFVVALTIGLAVVATPATAQDRIRSEITIGPGETAGGQGFLGGKVKSPTPKCERRRNVVLYFDAPPPPAGFVAVADDASNSNGRWRIRPASTVVPPGHYYVRITPIRRGGDKCKGARSETITVIGS